MSHATRHFVCAAIIALAHAGAGAETFYVAGNGNDTNDGLARSTPWRSIEAVNAAATTGDEVLFRRGDVFRGQVEAAGADMAFSAYGEGEAPVISGSAKLSRWTHHAGNVYAAPASRPIRHLFVDGELMRIARYPDTGWLRTDTGNAAAGFADAELANHPRNASGYWNGATLRIRSFSWLLDIRTVADYTSDGAITFDEDASWTIHPGYGYYLDGKLEELDAENEWLYDAATGRVYLYAPGGADPDTLLVEGSTYDYGIYLFWQKTGVRIENLAFRHQVEAGLRIESCDDATVRNNTFEDVADTGIHVAWNSANVLIEGNTVSRSLNYGIVWRTPIEFDVGESVIERNTIRDTALVAGYAASGIASMGINVLGNGVLVQYNDVDKTGHNGIFTGEGANIIEGNVVRRSLATLNDGGAVAIFSDGNTVRNNFLLDGIGNIRATGTVDGYRFPPLGMGILFGPGQRGNLIEGNTIAGNTHAGIYVDQAGGNTFRDNIFYNNEYEQLRFRGDDSSDYGNIVEDNVFFGLSPNQICLNLIGADNFGVFRRNYYGNAVGEVVIKQSNEDLSEARWYALEHWQETFPEQDLESETNALRFEEYDVSNPGENLIANPTFTDGTEGWDVHDGAAFHDVDAGALDSPSLRIEPDGLGASASPNAFALEAGRFYRLRFSTAADGHGTLRVRFFDETSDAWVILEERYFAVSTERKDETWVFQPSAATAQSGPHFNLVTGTPTFWLDNVYFEAVAATPVDMRENVRLVSNTSEDEQIVDLEGNEYLGLGCNTVSGSLAVPPLSSTILLLTKAATEGESEGEEGEGEGEGEGEAPTEGQGDPPAEGQGEGEREAEGEGADTKPTGGQCGKLDKPFSRQVLVSDALPLGAMLLALLAARRKP